jgi:hypothetical protein
LAGDDAQDYAGRDTNEQIVAAVVTDVVVTARRGAQPISAVIYRTIGVAIIRWKALTATPVAVAIVNIAVGCGRWAIMPAAIMGVAIVAATIPALAAAIVTAVVTIAVAAIIAIIPSMVAVTSVTVPPVIVATAITMLSCSVRWHG